MEVQIIFPSSVCKEDMLVRSVSDLEQAGFHPQYRFPNANTKLPFLASTVEGRVSELSSALLSSSDAPILCARGGYGASDLLPHIPWTKLKMRKTPKLLVGFSDISALQSALFSRLGWPSIHGPMPGTELWGQNGLEDLIALFQLLKAKDLKGSLKLRALSDPKSLGPLQGWLFGGCMSVLANLIGTPYFPHSLRGAIFFLEDTDEPPGRILRMLNQFLLSGLLQNASALVLGNFGQDDRASLDEEIVRRCPIPVFASESFGHISPNFPIVLGSNGVITNQELQWSYSR